MTKPIDVWLRTFRSKAGLLFCLITLFVCYGALATERDDLLSITSPQSLQGNLGASHHAQYVRIADRSLGIREIQKLPNDKWTDLTGGLSEGFTSSVIWVRFQITPSPQDESGEWFLELSQPLLTDVRLYSMSQEGQVKERLGTTISDQQRRELGYRNPTFVLKDEASGSQEYWLRISTPTALQTSLSLYKANQLMKKHARNDFIWGMLFGTYMFIVLFFMLFWFWTRERLHMYYTLYIMVNFFAAIFTSGWPIQYSENITSDTYIQYLGIWISLSLTTGTLLSCEFLQLHLKRPGIRRALIRTAAVLSTVGVIGTLGHRYDQVIPILQISSVILILVFLLIAIQGSISGDRISQVFLAAFSLFYIGVTWRYLRNLGWMESNFWSDNSYQLGAFAHMLVMSMTLFAGYSRLVKEKDQAQLALRYESQLRIDQRKFIDMVSHEFRTPLSVVQAALGNLMAKYQSHTETIERLQRIERASQRMYTLIKNYLDSERVMLDAQSPSLNRHNLTAICRLALEDLSEEHRSQITYSFSASPEIFCDMDLIRIAVVNLLQNACRHSQSMQKISLSIKVAAHTAIVEIADHGKGIAAEDVDHIFKRYYRGSDARNPEGSGLGLYIVQSIATGHHGRVTVRDNTPSGSVFSLELPL